MNQREACDLVTQLNEHGYFCYAVNVAKDKDSALDPGAWHVEVTGVVPQPAGQPN